jgi:hypothetical protein
MINVLFLFLISSIRLELNRPSIFKDKTSVKLQGRMINERENLERAIMKAFSFSFSRLRLE